MTLFNIKKYTSVLIDRGRFFSQQAKKSFGISCSNCIHNITYLTIDRFEQNVFHKGCRLYPYRDVLTRQPMYEYLHFCRSDEKKCGKNGKHFKLKNN